MLYKRLQTAPIPGVLSALDIRPGFPGVKIKHHAHVNQALRPIAALGPGIRQAVGPSATRSTPGASFLATCQVFQTGKRSNSTVWYILSWNNWF